MLARVATFNQMPEGLDSEAVDLLRRTVRETPGFVAGFHLLDPNTRKALSIVVVENQEAGRAVQAALAARPADARVGIDPDDVEFFEATSF